MQEKEKKLEEVIIDQALRIIQLEKDLSSSNFLGKIWQNKYYELLPKETNEVKTEVEDETLRPCF